MITKSRLGTELALLLLALASRVAGQELDPERVRLALIDAAETEMAADWSLACTDRTTSFGAAEHAPMQIGEWRIGGHPVRGPSEWRNRKNPDGTPTLYSLILRWRDGFILRAFPRDGFADITILPVSRGSEPSLSPVFVYTRPINNLPWLQVVSGQPLVTAEKMGEDLRILLLADDSVRSAAEAKRAVLGLVGFRVTLRRIESLYRVVRVEHVETEVLPPSLQDYGNPPPNPHLLENGDRFLVMDHLRCGIGRTVEFANFTKFGGGVFPLAYTVKQNAGSYVSRVDPSTLRELTTSEAAEISLSPPNFLGPVWRFHDARTGRTSYGSGKSQDPDRLIANMIEFGKTYDPVPIATPWPSRRSLVAFAILPIAGALLWWRRRAARRPRERGMSNAHARGAT